MQPYDQSITEDNYSSKAEHTGCYLDRQERDVSKLLVETGNLVIVNPGLVLCGHLRTTLIVRTVSDSS